MFGARSAPSATGEDGDKAGLLQLDVSGLARKLLGIGIETDVVAITRQADAAWSKTFR